MESNRTTVRLFDDRSVQNWMAFILVLGGHVNGGCRVYRREAVRYDRYCAACQRWSVFHLRQLILSTRFFLRFKPCNQSQSTTAFDWGQPLLISHCLEKHFRGCLDWKRASTSWLFSPISAICWYAAHRGGWRTQDGCSHDIISAWLSFFGLSRMWSLAELD